MDAHAQKQCAAAGTTRWEDQHGRSTPVHRAFSVGVCLDTTCSEGSPQLYSTGAVISSAVPSLAAEPLATAASRTSSAAHGVAPRSGKLAPARERFSHAQQPPVQHLLSTSQGRTAHRGGVAPTIRTASRCIQGALLITWREAGNGLGMATLIGGSQGGCCMQGIAEWIRFATSPWKTQPV
jgi:hypothetical protein